MSVVLRPAFSWNCNECGALNFEEATGVSDIDQEDAAMIAEHFETLDAVPSGDDQLETPYLVTRVVCGPPFVTCRKCGTTDAALLMEESE